MLILSLQNHACRHVALNRGISTQKTTIWGRPGFWFLMRLIEFHHKTCYACFSFETSVLINEAFYLYLRLLSSFKTADRSSCRTTLGILNLKWLVVVSLYTFSTIFFILVSCNERKAVNSKYLNQRETNWQPVTYASSKLTWKEKEKCPTEEDFSQSPAQFAKTFFSLLLVYFLRVREKIKWKSFSNELIFLRIR